MSRSYKKNPIYTDGKNGQVISKRFANKKVRKYKNKIAKGKSYKKLFCSYEIHDYISRMTWEEAKREYEQDDYNYYKNHNISLKEFYRRWRRAYKNK